MKRLSTESAVFSGNSQIFTVKNIHPVVVFLISLFFYLLFIVNNYLIYDYFRIESVSMLNSLIHYARVIVLFLIFNTCLFSYISYKSQRMLYYSFTFLIVAIVEALLIVYDGMVFPSQIVLTSQYYNLFSLMGKLVLAIGFIVATRVPIEKKSTRSRSIYLDLILSACAVVIFFLSSAYFFNIAGLHQKIIFEIALITLDYFIIGLLIVAAILYYRFYYLYNNQALLRMASGVIIIMFAQAVLLYVDNPPYINMLYSNIYMIMAYGIILKAVFQFNVKTPISELVVAEKQVKLYAENLEKIIDKRTKEIREVNRRLITELEYARTIQQSLLPLRRLNFRNATFYSEFFPCERLSGDFYDIYRIDDENIGMYVLDVSGHGVSAALMTMFCNNYIKSTERLIKRYRGLKPHRNLRHFYEEFNNMNFPDEMHMVIFFASYNVSSMELTYCTGGMNCYPIIIRKGGGYEYLDKSVGFPICKMNEFFTPIYESAKVKLNTGDRVIFYTDGLIDMTKNKIMDQGDLIETLISHKDDVIKVLNKDISQAISKHKDHLDDDITYFIMEVL